MRKTLVASLLLSIALLVGVAGPAQARSPKPPDWHLHPCGSRTHAVPTGEVERALRTSAMESGVSYALLRAIARGESAFDPKARNARHGGLFQHNKGYYPGRVKAFNKAHPHNLTNYHIYDIWGNTRVSAWMLSQKGGWRHWRC